MAVQAHDAQIGFAEEATYGVRVAPTRFYPVHEPDLNYEVERLESEGVVAGADVIGTDQWNGGPITVGGDVGFELYQDFAGLLFKHMFGTVQTTGAGPYTHTFTPGSIDDLSLCIQLGIPPVLGAAVIPVEFVGCKITDWELACAADEIATLGLTFAARDAHYGTRSVTDGVLNTTTTVTSASAAFTQADKGKLIAGTGITAGTTIASVTNATTIVLSAAATATATGVTLAIGATLATASYGTKASTPFKFNHAAVTVAGSSVDVTELSIKGANALKTDRRFLGSQLAAKALREGRREFTVELGQEFRDLTAINALKNGTEVAVVASFTGASTSVTFTMNCRYDAASPTTDGKSLAEQPVTLKCVRSSTGNGSAITAVVVSASETF